MERLHIWGKENGFHDRWDLAGAIILMCFLAVFVPLIVFWGGMYGYYGWRVTLDIFGIWEWDGPFWYVRENAGA